MKDDNLNKDNAKEYLKSILEVKDSMQELYALNRAYNVSLGKTDEYAKSINRQYGAQRALATEALKASRETLRTEGDRLALARISNNIEETANDMLRSRAQSQADLLLKQIMVKEGLTDEYAEQAKNYKLLLDKNVITEDVYQRHLQQLKAEQRSVNHLKEEVELYESVAEKQREILEEAEELKGSVTKFFETAKAIGRDPKVFGAFMLTQMVEKTKEVYEGFEELGKSGLAVGQRIDSMTKGFSLMSMVGLSDTKGVLAEMAQSMGTLNSLTSDEVNHVGHLAKEMGVSGEEAFQLVEGFSKLPGETMATAAHAADYVNSLSKANGVAPGKITKEIAKNTELIALGGYKGAKAFTDAAMKAQKMGVELQTTSKVMNGLLNFEDSINSQMEASVLLGREINLDKARQLALEGKSVEATEEVLKNIGGQAEFDKMNVLQKQALAKASGMTVEELNKAVDAQQEYNKYHGEDVATWKKGVGYAMEWGGATAKFMKENATALLASVQLLSNGNALQIVGNGLQMVKNGLLATMNGLAYATSLIYNKERQMEVAHWIKQKAQWIAQKAHLLFLKTQAAFGVEGAAGRAGALQRVMGKGAGGAAGAAGGALKKVGGGLTDKMTEAPGGKQTGGLTKAIEKIDVKKLLAGAAALVLVAAAVFVFAKAAQEFTSVPWSSIGKAIVAMLALVGALALIGAIMMSGVGALAILAGAAAMLVMAAALFVLGKAIQEIAKGFDMFIPALLQLAPMAKQIVVLGAGMVLLGAGMLALGYASFAAFPGLMLSSMALITMLPSLVLMNQIAQQGAFTLMGKGLLMMAAAGPGLGLVAMSMLGIAGGLGIMAYAGLAALPVIAALIGLAAVAPALVGLGAAIGGMFGGGGGEKEDKMDILINEIRALKAVAERGGTVNMDGKKVGEVMRLGLNSSGIK